MKRCILLGLLLLADGTASFGIDRPAFTATDYHLNVMIDRGSHVMAVDGTITLRNGSKSPQKNVALQVSSSLTWDRVLLNDTALEFLSSKYTSDIDHTGSLSEAIVTLPSAVAPGAGVTLQIRYGGTITADSTRLIRMGAPQDVALRNDWDQISESFTAVRGLGYVVWYPVAIEAVSMSEGTAVTDAIVLWKERHHNTHFEARISAEMDAGSNLAVVTNISGSEGGGKETKSLQRDNREQTVTFATNTLTLNSLASLVPALAIANLESFNRTSVEVFFTPEHSLIAKDYAAATEANEPLLKDWLPALSDNPIRIIELTEPDANPYQDGATLFVPLRSATQQNLQMLVLPTQVAARFATPRAWMQNGLGLYLQGILRRSQNGRDAALKFLGQYEVPLAKAEELSHPANAADAKSSQSDNTLLNTTDELYLRIKGGFVFWMLDAMLGDGPLQKALAAYRPEADKEPTYLQKLVEAQGKHDLEWFFDDWVYRDRGLPDFRIASAFSRKLLSGAANQYQITASVENRGAAGAEVPVRFETANGEKTLRIVVKAHDKALARMDLPELPTRVVVNDGSVPESDTTNNVYVFAAKPAE
jgi:hypothetical protein